MVWDPEARWQEIVELEKNKLINGKWGAFPDSAAPDRIFFYPDLHFRYHNKSFLQYLDAKCDEFNPTHIIQIGDLLDCYSLSSFDKDPDRKDTLNDERIMARDWLYERRSNNRGAVMEMVLGNHEQRIMRQIKKYLPGLRDLEELSIQSLLSLNEMNITLHPRSGFSRWGLRIKHGDSTAMHAAKKELEKHWCDGVSGHTHRKAECSFTTGEGHTYTWISLGHGCDMDFVDYTESPNWQLCGGTLVAWPDGRREWSYLTG